MWGKDRRWPRARVEKMFEMYVIGSYSAQETGDAIGMTRNAVIGKAAREFNGKRTITKRDIPWDYKKDQRLRNLKRLRRTWKQCVEIMGVSESTLQIKYNEKPILPPTPQKRAKRKSKEPKEPWQCQEPGCRHTRQTGVDLCAEHKTALYVANQPEVELIYREK